MLNRQMELQLGSLVELKDRFSDVYPHSPSGARGWVRRKRQEPQTEPEVWIEWDKGHWRYHGEQDGWTFEGHFQPVKDEPTAPAPEASNILHRILQQAQERVDEERCSHCGGFHDEQDAFINTLQEAQEAALGSDGYFIVTLTPRQNGEHTVYEPQIFAHALNDMAQRMIEAQLVHIASQLFEQRILKHIKNLDDDDGR